MYSNVTKPHALSHLFCFRLRTITITIHTVAKTVTPTTEPTIAVIGAFGVNDTVKGKSYYHYTLKAFNKRNLPDKHNII